MSDATNPAPADQPASRPLNALLSAAASTTGILLAFGTVLGVCLHLTGHVAHISQLGDWGVPSDLFPRGVEWTMINGYYAVFREWTRTIKDMPWGLLAIACLLLTFWIWLYRLPTREKRPAWVDRLPKWLRDILLALVASAATITAGFYLLFLVSLIAIVPGFIGERAGQDAAREDLKRFQSTPIADAPAELWRQDKPLMRGHVIAVSTELIAFYDSAQARVRVVDREGIELRSRPRVRPEATQDDRSGD